MDETGGGNRATGLLAQPEPEERGLPDVLQVSEPHQHLRGQDVDELVAYRLKKVAARELCPFDDAGEVVPQETAPVLFTGESAVDHPGQSQRISSALPLLPFPSPCCDFPKGFPQLTG